jgi:hypothetical protein
MAKNKNPAPVAADPENDGRVEEDDGLTEEVVLAATDALSTAVDWSSYGEDHAAQAVSLKPEEVLIAMIKIVQESSKIWKAEKDKPLAERSCQLGDIYNTITGDIYDGTEGIVIVPISCDECVIERKPSPDGSFLAKLKVRDPRVQEAYVANGEDKWRKLTSKQKTQLVYTQEVAVGLVTADGKDVYGVAMIPFSGTNVFPRTKWWNKMTEVPYGNVTPKYAFRTVLKTEFRQGVNGGVDSYRFIATPYTPEGKEYNQATAWSDCRFTPGHPALDRCLEFQKLHSSGALGKADYSEPDSETAAEAAALKDKPAF